jgi:hypothetical protein
MITIHQAIISLKPNAGFILQDDDINTLVWTKDDVTQPSNEDILAEQTRLQTEYDANQYQRDRVYPPLGEQFDKLWHDINNGTLDNTGAFYTALKTVKDDNPKPGE